MDEITMLLKILIYGIIGNIIFHFIVPYKTNIKGFYSLYYCLFSLVTFVTDSSNVLYLMLSGIFWSIIVKLFLDTIDKTLTPTLNPIWFGILNIVNYFFLAPIIDFYITASTTESVVILFILSTITFLIDLATILRKNL